MSESPKKSVKVKTELKKKEKCVVQKKLSSKERKGWTNEKQDMLSEVWELESVLYNRRNEYYSDPVERKNAEDRISQELDIDGMFVNHVIKLQISETNVVINIFKLKYLKQ